MSVDDTLCVKSVTAEALESVSFHHDHSAERAQHGQFSNAAKVLVLTLQVGPFCFAVDHRLYLERKQARQLNYQRAREGWREALTYQSLPDMAAEMLSDLRTPLQDIHSVYVLTDAWFSSLRLFKLITHDLHWHFIMASKGNRQLGRFKLSQWWSHLGHQSIQQVTIDSTKGSRTYLTRSVVKPLPRFGAAVQAVISKSGRRRNPFVYLLCSNSALSANTVMQYYSHRWSIEVVHAFCKGRLGLGDFRVHSVETTQRWFTLVFTTYAFITLFAVKAWLDHPAQLRLSASEVVLLHQSEQLRFLVAEVACRARAGESDLTILHWLDQT